MYFIIIMNFACKSHDSCNITVKMNEVSQITCKNNVLAEIIYVGSQ